MTVHRLLYRSRCAIPGAPADVEAEIGAIVARARAVNAQGGISGALLFTEGVFVQAIEGPIAAVEATFERICCDWRHRNVELIDLTQSKERMFDPWSMAAITPSGELTRICASFETVSGQRIDPANALATVQFMRTLIVTGRASARPAAA